MSELKLDIRDESLADYLRNSAEATGRTVEQVAIQAIKNGIRLDKEGMLATSHKIRRMRPRPLEEDSTDIIRRFRHG